MRSLPEAGYKVSGHKYGKCHPVRAAGSPAGLRNGSAGSGYNPLKRPIKALEIKEGEFEKTSTMKIKRYKELNNNK